MTERFGDRFGGDLREDDAPDPRVDRAVREADRVRDVPRDGFALAVEVGREPDLVLVLRRGLELRDDLLRAGEDRVRRLKAFSVSTPSFEPGRSRTCPKDAFTLTGPSRSGWRYRTSVLAFVGDSTMTRWPPLGSGVRRGEPFLAVGFLRAGTFAFFAFAPLRRGFAAGFFLVVFWSVNVVLSSLKEARGRIRRPPGPWVQGLPRCKPSSHTPSAAGDTWPSSA